MYGASLVRDCGADVVRCRAFVIARIHQLCACQLQAAVVPVALAALNYDLVFHSRGIGQLLYEVVVRSCHVGGGCQRQCRAGSGCDVGGWNADQLRYSVPYRLLELDEWDIGAVGCYHRLFHLWQRRGTAQ